MPLQCKAEITLKDVKDSTKETIQLVIVYYCLTFSEVYILRKTTLGNTLEIVDQ